MMNIVLDASSSKLDEVVVVGYGTQKVKDLIDEIIFKTKLIFYFNVLYSITVCDGCVIAEWKSTDTSIN